MAAEDLLVFVHIPKCAGTALCDWMRESNLAGYGGLYFGYDEPIARLRWSEIDPAQYDGRRMRS